LFYNYQKIEYPVVLSSIFKIAINQAFFQWLVEQKHFKPQNGKFIVYNEIDLKGFVKTRRGI